VDSAKAENENGAFESENTSKEVSPRVLIDIEPQYISKVVQNSPK
jgi:uncharacterized membrane protein